MGMPALRRQPRQEAAKPRLRLVSPAERSPRTRARKSAPSACTPRTPSGRVFTTFVICATVVAALGVGRVALSAASARVSLESAELREQIKEARYEGDMLEVQQSALAAPSRVRAVAGKTLSLAEPSSVSYLGIADSDAVARASKPKPSTTSAVRAKKAVARSAGAKPHARGREDVGLGPLVSKMMDVAAGEAQVLLVGDVGLASAE